MGLGAAIGKLPGALARWVCKFLPRLTRASLPRTARASTFRKSKPRRSVSSDDAEGEASGRSRRELWKRKPGPNPRDLTIRMPHEVQFLTIIAADDLVSAPRDFVQGTAGFLSGAAALPRGLATWLEGRGARRRRHWRHNDTRERSPRVRSRVARLHRRAPGSLRRLRAVVSLASRAYSAGGGSRRIASGRAPV